jgi:hypothetical protein
MPRVRLDLKPQTYEALAARAVEERRPIDWQAEVLIESGLGLRVSRSTRRTPAKRDAPHAPTGERPERVSA